MALTFEWDESKDQENLIKHGVGIEEAKSVFNDPLAITIYDPDHSISEDRFIDLGYSVKKRLLIVVYTDRDEVIRLISCRVATPRERLNYEQG